MMPGAQTENPALRAGFWSGIRPGSVRDFSRGSQIRLWAAVLFQGTVGSFARSLDLIAGGVSSMRNLLRALLPMRRRSRGLTGSSSETGPFQQTLAMAILRGFQATHG